MNSTNPALPASAFQRTRSADASQPDAGRSAVAAAARPETPAGSGDGIFAKISRALTAVAKATINKVESFAQAHPDAAVVLGLSFAALCAVGMAVGGPAGLVFGTAGLAAGLYVALKGWRAGQTQTAWPEVNASPLREGIEREASPRAAPAPLQREPSLASSPAVEPVEQGSESPTSPVVEPVKFVRVRTRPEMPRTLLPENEAGPSRSADQ